MAKEHDIKSHEHINATFGTIKKLFYILANEKVDNNNWSLKCERIFMTIIHD
jgi:hypothetical protein